MRQLSKPGRQVDCGRQSTNTGGKLRGVVMRPITGTVADVRQKLQDMTLPEEQEVTVVFQSKADRQALLDSMQALTAEAARNGMTYKDLKDALEIDEEEFQRIFDHPSA